MNSNKGYIPGIESECIIDRRHRVLHCRGTWWQARGRRPYLFSLPPGLWSSCGALRMLENVLISTGRSLPGNRMVSCFRVACLQKPLALIPMCYAAVMGSDAIRLKRTLLMLVMVMLLTILHYAIPAHTIYCLQSGRRAPVLVPQHISPAENEMMLFR